MSIRKRVLTLLVLTAASCDQAPKVDPSKPAAYAVQLPLEPAKAGALQRLALPAEALIALQRADLGDARIFDARDKVVPIALLDDRANDIQNSTSVGVYPIIGPVTLLGSSELSIRVQGNGSAQVVTLDQSARPVGSAVPPAAALLDTRFTRQPVVAIAFGIDIPAGTPVTLTLLSSTNLKDWEPLAGKVLFRPREGAALLGDAKVALPGVDLRDRYVGISWGGTTGVTLRSASVTTAAAAPPARTVVATSATSLVDAHELRFDLPAMARLAAVRLTLANSDGVVLVKLSGRNQAQAPWTPLASTTLRPGENGNLLEVGASPMTSYRVQADRRTAGFSTLPKLELLFDPVELIVALSGTPPYRLAVGNKAAPATYLTLAEIAPQDSLPNLAALPQAKISRSDREAPIVALLPSASDGALEPRKLALWAALLLGTLVLGLAAIRLLRMTAQSAATEGKDIPNRGF